MQAVTVQTGKGSRPAVSQVAPPLRLTRRGRVVVAGLVALLVTVGMAAAAGAAQASSHGLPARVVERDLARVTVGPGQSLWSVAQGADPDADPRAVIQEIIELNVLAGTTIYPGERLWVPRQ